MPFRIFVPALFCLLSSSMVTADTDQTILRCVVESVEDRVGHWHSFTPPEVGDSLIIDPSVPSIVESIRFEPRDHPDLGRQWPLISLSALDGKPMQRLLPSLDAASHLVVWEGSTIDWTVSTANRTQHAFRLEVGHFLAGWYAMIQSLGRSPFLGWTLANLHLRCEPVGDQ